ncbi:hypothetical protein LTR02_012885 [Friedmanniomyces endolithicus]|nr:hypothetical protein LTR94_012792 [Friedmanniomyces endolithicus]KAK0779507.1 hypothetical protein LTR59_013151 [Friedmanniomyces endolithicus]KAK0783084.1 hypothetical protein LTR75_014233 [Friedmanniomyces endolithicus]KAK0785080.1 hypothetical protein LTR38_012457 [Friedmanniomyces endolithicus]KAK0836397.1 hypothetical protein LTR03_013697 [Friedmanniomyces endolithicus]
MALISGGPRDEQDDVYIMPAYTAPVAAADDIDTTSTASIAKRKADSPLAPEKVKRPRASSEATEDVNDPDLSDIGSAEAEEVSEPLKGDDTEVSNTRTLRSSVTGVQKDVSNAPPKSRASSGGVSNAVRDSIKQEYKVKLETEKDQYETKLASAKANFQARLDSKHSLYQQKIDELKATHAESLKAKEAALREKSEKNRLKCNAMVKAAKLEEQKAKTDLADAKKDYAELGKTLKAEQLSEIKKWMPEFSPLLAEKEKAIKELRLKLTNTQAEVKLCEQEIARTEAKNEILDTVKEKLEAAEKCLRAEVLGKKQEITEMCGQHAAEMVELRERLRCEGDRWQVLYSRAEGLEFKLVAQQRANFELRGMNAGRDARILELSKGISGVEGGGGRAKVGSEVDG